MQSEALHNLPAIGGSVHFGSRKVIATLSRTALFHPPRFSLVKGHSEHEPLVEECNNIMNSVGSGVCNIAVNLLCCFFWAYIRNQAALRQVDYLLQSWDTNVRLVFSKDGFDQDSCWIEEYSPENDGEIRLYQS